MIKESGVNMDNQLYNQIKAVHEQYIKEQNRLEDEIDRLRREIDVSIMKMKSKP